MEWLATFGATGLPEADHREGPKSKTVQVLRPFAGCFTGVISDTPDLKESCFVRNPSRHLSCTAAGRWTNGNQRTRIERASRHQSQQI